MEICLEEESPVIKLEHIEEPLYMKTEPEQIENPDADFFVANEVFECELYNKDGQICTDTFKTTLARKMHQTERHKAYFDTGLRFFNYFIKFKQKLRNRQKNSKFYEKFGELLVHCILYIFGVNISRQHKKIDIFF